MKKAKFRELYKDLKIIKPKEFTEENVFVKEIKKEKPKTTTKKKESK